MTVFRSRLNPDHSPMDKGRDRLYQFYDIKICTVDRSSSFEA